MSPPHRVEIPRVSGYDCFACGTENPISLGMRFYAEGERVCSDVVLDRHRVGWQTMAHGGIVTTLLDEVMAWTVLYFKESFCVTRKIQVRFRKPVPVETPLTVRGEIVETPRRFACSVKGVVTDQGGEVLAEAESDFALLSSGQVELLPDAAQQDVERFLAALREAKSASGV